MITPELQKSLDRSVELASSRRHEYLTLEHVLYALLDEKTASEVIRNCGGDVGQLKSELEEYLREQIEALPEDVQAAPQPTEAFERALHRALLQAHNSSQATINGGNLLAAMFQEKRSHAVYLLEKQGISRLDVLSYISHGISKEHSSLPEPAG